MTNKRKELMQQVAREKHNNAGGNSRSYINFTKHYMLSQTADEDGVPVIELYRVTDLLTVTDTGGSMPEPVFVAQSAADAAALAQVLDKFIELIDGGALEDQSPTVIDVLKAIEVENAVRNTEPSAQSVNESLKVIDSSTVNPVS